MPLDEDAVTKIYALREHYARLMDSAADDAEYYQAYAAFGAVSEVLEIID